MEIIISFLIAWLLAGLLAFSFLALLLQAGRHTRKATDSKRPLLRGVTNPK